MAFGSLDDTQAAREPMADINTTPLVDVMLVLLVIFIITAPLFTHAVKLDLPDQPAATIQDRERPIVISIDAEGQVFWDDTKLTDAEFDARLSALAQAAKAGKPAPALHLRADKATRYERVAMVMAQAQQQGLTRLAFVTDPKAAPVAPAGAAATPDAAATARPSAAPPPAATQ